MKLSYRQLGYTVIEYLKWEICSLKHYVAVPGVSKPDTRQQPQTNDDYANYLARMRNILHLFQEQPELVEQWEKAQLSSALDGDEVS